VVVEVELRQLLFIYLIIALGYRAEVPYRLKEICLL